MTRVSLSPALCGSLPEAGLLIEEGAAFVVAENGVNDISEDGFW